MPTRPTLPLDLLAARLRRDWAVDGTLHPLYGEWDQNLRVEVEGVDRFVLKVSPLQAETSVLSAQAAAMDQLAAAGVPAPRVVPTTAGAAATTIQGHRVRLLRWLPGRLWADVQPTARLREDLGRHLGRVTRALQGFDHPGAHRVLDWDLARGATVVAQGRDLLDEQIGPVVDAAMQVVSVHALPLLPDLRRSVIHNDANPGNVLVSEGEVEPRIAGLIDFGDIVHAPTVDELAIAAAYACLDEAEPLDAICDLAAGMHAVFPLTAEELAALYGLVLLRLCVSATMAARQQRLRPDDPYLSVSQAPLRRTLPRLLERPPDLAQAALRTAIGWLPAPVPRATRHATADLLAARRAHAATNLRLSYREPLHLVRGWKQHLFAADGRRYLDAYNNVPHVGHAHPRVVAAVADQAARLSSNTRYLADIRQAYVERLLATAPPALDVCFLLSSASEANELALRLCRAATGARDTLVQEAGYHGHTTTLVDLSPYKHGGPGGQGAPPWVHVLPLPTRHRDTSQHLAAADAVLDSIDAPLAALLVETCPSVGGQLIPPAGYLAGLYRRVRAKGGLCIADEVQTGLGRLGRCFYAFEEHDVVPDIVVLGKPLGNGMPLAAVLTTRAIADAFDTGMEFFSTFGGNQVSCAAGLAVLEVMEDEGLQANAAAVGDQLLAGLRNLAADHAVIADVRGAGLFIGVELVDPETGAPGTRQAAAVAQAMCDAGVLIGTDGPHHEVLKIRPPLCFGPADAEALLASLGAALTALPR